MILNRVRYQMSACALSESTYTLFITRKLKGLSWSFFFLSRPYSFPTNSISACPVAYEHCWLISVNESICVFKLIWMKMTGIWGMYFQVHVNIPFPPSSLLVVILNVHVWQVLSVVACFLFLCGEFKMVTDKNCRWACFLGDSIIAAIN